MHWVKSTRIIPVVYSNLCIVSLCFVIHSDLPLLFWKLHASSLALNAPHARAFLSFTLKTLLDKGTLTHTSLWFLHPPSPLFSGFPSKKEKKMQEYAIVEQKQWSKLHGARTTQEGGVSMVVSIRYHFIASLCEICKKP